MCGRTACTLDHDDIEKACGYRDKKTKKFKKAEWKNTTTGGRSYVPSHNVAPTNITPVLVSGAHFEDERERVLLPMMWGMIPPWHKGDYKSHGLSTNNCRIENLDKSMMYKKPFIQGKRCVVVCDGFYEWQTTKGKGSKQPYFIYSPQPSEVQIDVSNNWDKTLDEESGWKGAQLLKMAALFDTWISPEKVEFHSYSIITLESNSTLSWLHHRMPAILDTDELVADWLDFGRVNTTDALVCIKPVLKLEWYTVSTLVNNSRNKDSSCNTPIKPEDEKPKKPTMMENWLAGGKAKSKMKKEEIKDEPEQSTVGHTQLDKDVKTELNSGENDKRELEEGGAERKIKKQKT